MIQAWIVKDSCSRKRRGKLWKRRKIKNKQTKVKGRVEVEVSV
jgi:hypothetical protein